ncbi:MAG: tRNA (N(6)-L-threonylcarbamoyladenosine(37)-C(2))-methylthiotransferase MtaB, partial [Anaerostipes faecalis]|nr:tRNA (N(6)-L-threonylcarbamoyladenosine(37)-C(2))-methylthiotransferase MtaB [Anaerostipes faecalis]
HQVNDQIKTKRSNILLEMSQKHQQEFEEAQLGMTKEILIEESLHGKENFYTGHTREYIKTAVYSEIPLENQIIHAQLKRISPDGYVEGDVI